MSAHAPLNRAKHGFRSQAIGRESQVEGYTREKDDFFPTPARATNALLDVERFEGTIWEPACGDGVISVVCEERGYLVVSTDLVDRGYGKSRIDFLMETASSAQNIITNPPFKLAVPFVRQACRLAPRKIAMLLKIAFLEGVERAALFQETPLARVWVFSRRLAFVPSGDGPKPEGGGMMAFAWFVWDHAHVGAPTIGWLP